MRLRLASPTVQGLVIAGLSLFLALAAVSWLAIGSGAQLLFPELAQKALAEADQARRRVDAAIELGIPVERLVGVDALFADMHRNDADIAFLALTGDAPGDRPLFLYGLEEADFRRLLAAPGQAAAREGLAESQRLRAGYLVTALPLRSGTLLLGHDEQALVRPLVDNLFDIAVVVLVAMLLAFEVMLVVITANVAQPARAAVAVLKSIAEGRPGPVTGTAAAGTLGSFIARLDVFSATAAGQPAAAVRPGASIVGVRLLAFLFVFAEELGRPFLPVYVAEFAAATPQLNPNLATGLLIGLHMSVVALVMPFATILYSRLGRVRLYAAGALLATAGLAGTALAAGYWDLLAWRALSAVGYATTFVACQGFVIETTSRDNRATGMAMMVSGITLADICGPAFGGVMAERFGQSTTFLIAAGMAAAAALLVARLMAGGARRAETPRHVTLRDFAVALRNRPLVIQVCLAALPAKLLLTGFLFYLVPVVLLGIGQQEADVGRIVMVYGLAMLVGGPVFARLTDRWQNHAALVAAGGAVSSVLLILIPFVDEGSAAMVAILTVAALGIGQAMSIPAQVSMVVGMASEREVRQGQAPELTVLRFIERFGGGAGPMIAAPLAAQFGAAQAIGLFGIYGLASALLYALVAVRPVRTGAP